MIRIVSLMIALLYQAGAGAAASVAGDVMTEPVTGMEFVWVPKGCFQPGVLDAKPGRAAVKTDAVVGAQSVSTGQIHEVDLLDDGPDAAADDVAAEPIFIDQNMAAPVAADRDRVCLKRGFWMSRYEVTQGQYKQVIGENPSAFNKGDNYPVERVRWFDARKFIRKLNKLAGGKHFRLPSEAEWEYAARSGGKNQRYGAAGKPADVAWFMDNSHYVSHPVGQKLANAFGLYDMSGNVWEWTADCWNPTLAAMPRDGSPAKSGNCAARVLRGGSWYDAEELIRSTARLWNDSDKFDNNSGFRLVHE